MRSNVGPELVSLARSAMCRTRLAHRPAPSLFFYPGLTSKAWWSSSDFPWLQSLMQNRDVMLQEYKELSSKVPSDYTLKSDEHKLHDGEWKWHTAVAKGALQPQFQLFCPRTSTMLQKIPDLMTDGIPFAYTFFSSLEPAARISPHFGPCNIRLRIHIPLDIPSCKPEECGIRVGGDTRAWTAEEPLIFDDTYEHETWNTTNAARLILLMDIWHPDLSSGERKGISNMFESARAQGWLS